MTSISFLPFFILAFKIVSGNPLSTFDTNGFGTENASNRTWMCPENNQRQENLWELYDNTTQKCYQPKTKGPCNSYEIFNQEKYGSENGVCRCADATPTVSSKIKIPLALSPVDGKCYPLYDKASCKEGEWLVLDSNSLPPFSGESWKGVCKKNPCLEDSKSNNETVDTLTLLKFLGFEYYKTREDFKCSDIENSLGKMHPLDLNKPFWFLHEDKCYKTFTKGPCMEGKLIVFMGNSPFPSCYDPVTRFSNPIAYGDTKNTNDNDSTLGGFSHQGFGQINDPNSGKSWLCPENDKPHNTDERYWKLYDNVTDKCYSAFKNGPCNGTFKYLGQKSKGSEVGECRNLSPLNKLAFQKLNRPIAESTKDGEVYLVYSQGNCNDGEWFVFDENWQGVCKHNPCVTTAESKAEVPVVNTTELITYLGYAPYTTYDDFRPHEIETFPVGHPLDIHKPFWFMYKGKCYKYFSRGPCDDGEVLVFRNLNPIPLCYNPNVIYESVQAPHSSSEGAGGGGVTATGEQTCNGCMSGNKCVPCRKGGAADFS